ncbi:hypothetical protein [Sandarakinorhabdus sp.]|uniref:hypothetical protein n=1 Tax=Sandarakinorhabdus sp. TaxID=1916663 RepID=UPI0035691ACB
MTETATIEDLARAADDAGALLADDLNGLADRLTPRRLIDDALDVVKTRGADLARDAGNVVKAHPVATGAAVAAIGLALYAGKRISNAELDLGDGLDDYSDYDDSALTAAASDGTAVQDARALVKDNPVVAILAGIAAGVALALLFPTSAAEKRSLGALGRRLTSL